MKTKIDDSIYLGVGKFVVWPIIFLLFIGIFIETISIIYGFGINSIDFFKYLFSHKISENLVMILITIPVPVIAIIWWSIWKLFSKNKKPAKKYREGGLPPTFID